MALSIIVLFKHQFNFLLEKGNGWYQVFVHTSTSKTKLFLIVRYRYISFKQL